ncbi:hypothetical protein ES703_13480 [subsurface metagenome]
MVSGPHPGQPTPGLGKVAEQLFGWPSPEKVLFELQRLNNCMELIQPDLHKLANSLDALTGPDVRNLTAALNKINVGDLLRAVNEFNRIGSQISEKLWGKK